MTSTSLRSDLSDAWALLIYLLICVFSVGLDLATDRSFGAVMLAVLPISFVSLVCLLVGPWMEGNRKLVAARAWLVGALLTLLISIAFGSLGPDQAKTGELIFTYAALIMALPASLVLPFVLLSMEALAPQNVIMRIVASWAVCVAAGWLEWIALTWLCSTIHQRK